jgi:hypothetical protein
VAVPLCLLLGLCGFSKALTGVLVFLVTVALVATDALTESAKVRAGCLRLSAGVSVCAGCLNKS